MTNKVIIWRTFVFNICPSKYQTLHNYNNLVGQKNIFFFLGNREYQLSEGACNVRLEFNAKTCSQLVKVQPGSYCEVLGEVLLMPKEVNHDDHLTKSSSRYFVQTLNIIKGTSKDASEANERERKLSSFYQKYYQPVIRVWFINSVNRPTEVITRNLELRHLLAQIIVDEEEQTSSSPSSSSSRKAEA